MKDKGVKLTYTEEKLSDSPGYNMFVRVLSVILATLGFIAFYRVLAGLEPITFTGFLETITQFDFSGVNVFQDLTIYDDWGIFNGFRDFLNVLGGVVSAVVYLATMSVKLILAAGSLMAWFFGIT